MSSFNKEQIQMIALISIVFIGLFCGTYFILISPDMQSLDEFAGKKQEIQKKLSEKQKTANQLEPTKKEIESLNQKLAEYKKTVITTSEFDFFKDTLRDMGNEYNVKVIRDNTVSIEDLRKSVFKDDLNYSEKETSLDITCKYHEFGSFLNRVENTSPFRMISSIDISKKGDSKGGGTLGINVKIISLLSENPA